MCVKDVSTYIYILYIQLYELIYEFVSIHEILISITFFKAQKKSIVGLNIYLLFTPQLEGANWQYGCSILVGNMHYHFPRKFRCFICIFDYSRTTSGNKSRNMTFLMHLRQCHNKLITFIFNLKQAKPFPKTL